MNLFDTAAEDKVIGTYLRHPHLFRNPLPEEQFHQRSLHVLLGQMQRQQDRTGTLDVAALIDDILDRRLEDEIGGIEAIPRLYASACTDPASIEMYTVRVKQAFKARKMAEISALISDRMAASSDLDLDSLQAEITFRLQNLNSGLVNTSRFMTATQLADRYLELLESAARGEVRMRGHRTLLSDRLDSQWVNLLSGTLQVIGARPSVGKTAFALEIARLIATGELGPDDTPELFKALHGRDPQPGIKVGFIEKEMGWSELMQRVSAAGSDLDLNTWAEDIFPAWGLEQVRAYLESFKGLPFILDDSPETGLREVLDSIAYMADQGCKVIVVDYLQLLDNNLPDAKSSDNRNIEVGKISKALKRAARQHDVAIILLSQLSRPVGEKTEITRPTLKSLRDSGSIEADADTVIFLWSDQKDYRERLEAKIILTGEKQRGGPPFEIPLRFVKNKQRFAVWLEDHDPTKIENETVNDDAA